MRLLGKVIPSPFLNRNVAESVKDIRVNYLNTVISCIGYVRSEKQGKYLYSASLITSCNVFLFRHRFQRI
jgi:hypothetical protein